MVRYFGKKAKRRRIGNTGRQYERTGEGAPDDRDSSPFEYTETDEGREALERWAARYDDLNGAPEGDWDV